MKRCPECSRDYDHSMMFCLDDGAELLYGPAPLDEPATAVVSGLGTAATEPPINESPPHSQNHKTADQTALFHRRADADPSRSSDLLEGAGLPASRSEQRGKAAGDKLKTRIIIGAVLLLAVGGLSFAIYKFGLQTKVPVVTAQMKLTRLTTSGKATVAAISPDGRYVVHAMEDNGQQSLWMRQTATQSNVQIVPPAAVNYSRLIFSPDGDYLFYTAAAERNVGDATLYRIAVLGGSPLKLISNISSFMALSPDASQIVFKREFPAEGIDTLMIANVDGSNERRLSTRKMPERSFEVGGARSAPSWSPDGKTIACRVTSVEGGVIHHSVTAIDVNSGRETPITSHNIYSLGQVAWLNDQSGLIILAAEEQGGAAQLWHVSYPEGEMRRITNDFNDYRAISMTADSKSLVAVQLQQTSSVWIAPPNDTARARQITSGAGRNDSSVRWTPDNEMVFSSNASGSSNLWIMNADGGDQKQLTTDGGILGLSVSPDGSYIVFRSNRAGVAHIFRMDADGGNVKQLTNGSGEFVPVFSIDSKWVLYNSRQSGKITLWRVPVDGGEPRQLTDLHSYGIGDVSPDGKWLTANYREDAPNSPDKVGLFPIEGGAPAKTFDNIPPRSQSIRWTPDSRGLIYIVTRDGVSNLWSQALDGGAPKQMTDFSEQRIFSFDYSRDGKQLALSRGTISNDVVLISNFK